MKQRYSACLIMILGLLIILPGCFKVPSYKAIYMPSVDIASVYQKTVDGVTVQIKQLNKAERDYFFGDNSTLLLKQPSDKRIVPLYIAIVNHGRHVYTISPENIDLELLPYDYIFNVIKVNTKKIAGIAFGVGGTLGAMCLMPFVEDRSNPSDLDYCVAGLMGGIAGGVAGLYMASPSWLKSMDTNRRIKNDLRKKTLHKKVILKPGDEYAGLIFVKQEDYLPDFAVTIDSDNAINQKMVFNVDLKKNQYAI
jgi:hypothetical protein